MSLFCFIVDSGRTGTDVFGPPKSPPPRPFSYYSNEKRLRKGTST